VHAEDAVPIGVPQPAAEHSHTIVADLQTQLIVLVALQAHIHGAGSGMAQDVGRLYG